MGDIGDWLIPALESLFPHLPAPVGPLSEDNIVTAVSRPRIQVSATYSFRVRTGISRIKGPKPAKQSLHRALRIRLLFPLKALAGRLDQTCSLETLNGVLSGSFRLGSFVRSFSWRKLEWARHFINGRGLQDLQTRSVSLSAVIMKFLFAGLGTIAAVAALRPHQMRDCKPNHASSMLKKLPEGRDFCHSMVQSSGYSYSQTVTVTTTVTAKPCVVRTATSVQTVPFTKT